MTRCEPSASSGNPAELAQVFSDILCKRKDSALHSLWDFDAETYTPVGRGAQSVRMGEGFPSIKAPSVRVSCGSKQCKGPVQPHNSGYLGGHPEINSYNVSHNQSIVQILSFAYQCQNCKGEPLVFRVSWAKCG